MTNVAHLLRGLLLPVLVPVLAGTVAAGTVVAGTALPAAAARSATAAPVTRSGQWWLTALHVPAALLAAPTAGRGVTVAVLSTGVDAGHPDLAGSVIVGPDLSGTGRKQGGPEWGEEGTGVASLIAGHGHGPGGVDGITGIAPGAKILSVQVTLEYDDQLNSDATLTRGLPAAIAAGIRYAVSHRASIIALPLDPGTLGPAAGGDPAAAGGSAAERAAVGYALSRDVLLVAPAGDNGAGTDAVNYPAAYPGVIAVGATAQTGKLAVFTSDRSYVALTAPGAGDMPDVPVSGGRSADPAAGLTVAAPDGGYQSLASTDMSAALTAGVAALIRARYPRLTVAAVTQALERGATKTPGRGAGAGPAAAGWGNGELNATAALDVAALLATPPSPTTSAPPSAAAAAPSAVPRTTSARPDPGHLLRSLVTGVAIVAGLLIACLIGVTALTRRRRRARAGFARTRPRHRAGGARHARPPGGAVRQSLPTTAAWPGAQARRPRPADEPPWPPALPPGREPPLVLPPTRALPPSRVRPAHRALPAARALPPARSRPVAQPEPPPAHAPLAPWEQSPDEYAAASGQPDVTPWPVSSTGPMYVWNPAATTGPLNVVDDEAE